MKDMPAALIVALSVRNSVLMHKIFDRVVDNGRVLRTVFQMIRSGRFARSGQTARKGLSSSLQRAFQRWLNEASVGKLLSDSIGNDPSLRDILRMARPTPNDNTHRSLYGWLTNKEVAKWAPAADAEDIRRSRQFPYQFMAAYMNADDTLPHQIRTALHQAAKIACGNIPQLTGPVVIGLDTSGSMSSAITGHRGRGATSKMRCVDVAALFAAAILRRNPDSVVIPFDTAAYQTWIDPSDTILSIAERLSKYGGGGTDCSLPIAEANTRYAKRKFAGIVLVSDNESWVGTGRGGSTAVMSQWTALSCTLNEHSSLVKKSRRFVNRF